MNPLYFTQNTMSFQQVVGMNGYGRLLIETNATEINAGNVVEELNKALATHNVNVPAIIYLDRYYRGDQPILYREKKVRPEINNKVVENHALEIVDSKVADLYGEPIQYVLSDAEDKSKAKQMKDLNRFMKSEDKAALDIERGRYRSMSFRKR